MPLPTDIPQAAIEGVKAIISRGIDQAAAVLLEDFVQLARDLWAAFPNLVAMLDLVMRFGTGLAGRIITIPFAGIEGLLLDLLRTMKLNNRVMTTESFVKSSIRALGSVVTTLTMTGESGIVESMLAALGRATWRVWKHLKFIQALTRIRSEAELVQYFIRSRITNNLRFYGVILFVVGVFAAVAWTGALAMLMAMSLSFIDGSFRDHLLAQDSKREWRSGGAVVRKNKRRGPDT